MGEVGFATAKPGGGLHQPLARVAFLFPGQGSQHPGMGAELLADSEVAELCDRCSHSADVDLRHLLVGADDDELRLTQNAQPALCFMGVALTMLLAKRGIEPSAAAGHSVGEYAALAAGGAVGAPQVIKAVVERGRAMAEAVTAGTTAGLEVGAKRLQEAGAKRVIPLNVSAAFHTPLMAPAAERLRLALDRIEWRSPRVPVMANLTGRQHQGGDRIPHVLEMQLRSPVRWAACMAALLELGCDTFVEVGPKRALTGMMRELAPGKTALAVGTPTAVQEVTA